MMTDLYKKYKADHFQETSKLNPLSFILRKAELGEMLKRTEWVWLDKHQLNDTKVIIKSQENYRNSILREIHNELIELNQNQFLLSLYSRAIPPINSERALVLYKLHTQEELSDTELRFVNENYHKYIDFINRKQKYKITEEIPFDKNFETILSKLEDEIPLCADDIECLCKCNAYSFLYSLKNQFAHLKKKYKALGQKESEEYSLLLFRILQQLDEKKLPNQEETQYLRKNEFNETLVQAQQIDFSLLKKKYRATQIQENNIAHHLYKVLKKLDAGLSLHESDINFLKNRKLNETVKFAYHKERDALIRKIARGHDLKPNDIAWCEEHDFEEIIFRWLENAFELGNYKIAKEPRLVAILKKMKADNRLNDDEVVVLQCRNLLQPSSKIFTTHHKLEAQFCEKQFQRTKNHWDLVNASAHWRKADDPRKALKQTDSVVVKQAKPGKVKAALFTTRGGALRDINKLKEAEKCALEAIKQYPDSHNPYTLMGALCYQTRRYEEGHRWFEEAIKRGAKPYNHDAEIKRILRKKYDPELIKYLLKKDPDRFYWVKDFSRKWHNKKGRK
ncbi:hypothetical protein QUF90_20375 [Desulfococcaceae bacterium HSG9]|nr:hypothetical protein [Desulfococcaceae bacterium HSG9]